MSVLADPRSIFVRALSKFHNRILYANVVNDRSAVYYTTSISKTDPFTKPDKLKINYIEGYEPVIIDPNIPLSYQDVNSTQTLYSRVRSEIRTVLTRIPMLAILLVLIPIGSVVFLIGSGIQIMRSQKRIRLHEEGKAGVGIGSYRVPVMVENARNAVEETLESINASNNPQYLPRQRGKDSGTPATPIKDEAETSRLDLRLNPIQALHIKFPTLALTQEQFSMIDTLDAIGMQLLGVSSSFPRSYATLPKLFNLRCSPRFHIHPHVYPTA